VITSSLYCITSLRKRPCGMVRNVCRSWKRWRVLSNDHVCDGLDAVKRRWAYSRLCLEHRNQWHKRRVWVRVGQVFVLAHCPRLLYLHIHARCVESTTDGTQAKARDPAPTNKPWISGAALRWRISAPLPVSAAFGPSGSAASTVVSFLWLLARVESNHAHNIAGTTSTTCADESRSGPERWRARC
jgi:hypothetical protein